MHNSHFRSQHRHRFVRLSTYRWRKLRLRVHCGALWRSVDHRHDPGRLRGRWGVRAVLRFAVQSVAPTVLSKGRISVSAIARVSLVFTRRNNVGLVVSVPAVVSPRLTVLSSVRFSCPLRRSVPRGTKNGGCHSIQQGLLPMDVG